MQPLHHDRLAKGPRPRHLAVFAVQLVAPFRAANSGPTLPGGTRAARQRVGPEPRASVIGPAHEDEGEHEPGLADHGVVA